MKYIPARNAICYITLLLVLVATMLLAPASTLEAQASVQSGTPQEEAPTVDYRFYERDVIEIKFREGQRIRLRNGALTDLSGQALENAPALAVLEAVADGTWTRTHQVNEEKLDQMRQEGLARGEKSLPDLNLWFRLQLPPGMEAAEAIALFNALDEVEGAFPVPKPAPPPLPPDYSIPNDDNFDDRPNFNRNIYQRYLDPAPTGLDFRFAWQGYGGKGEGIAICDIEYGWNENHADLPEVTLLGDEPRDGLEESWLEHGTAVLGQLAALDNGWGVTGMVPEVELYFAAASTASGYNVAAAVTRCANKLSAGDVILIEQQISGPNATGEGQQGLVPVEWNKATYDAIKNAVAKGIVVVEAAGNGGEDLDDAVYSTGNNGHHPFKTANDSGAIIVGSANSPYTSSPRSRLSSSNYGSTVDLHGWGRDIVTTGYGFYYDDEGKDLWYTHAFGGTSGASPMVTAAVAVAQSNYIKKSGTPATPATVKNTLRNTGTPQVGTENIGPQPNLKAALEEIWVITPQSIAKPTISPNSGTFDMPINVTIDYGSQAQNWNNTSIRFTLDGSEPGIDDYMYIPEQDSGVYLLYGVTLKAKAFQYHAPAERLFESEVVERNYVSTTPKVATPVISPEAGHYSQPRQVTISTSTPGAEIRYRTDGRSISLFYPGKPYTGPFELPPGNHEITAKAYKDGYYASDLARSGEIVVSSTKLPTPDIYPMGGNFAGQTTVFLSSTVLGADIRYTLDGSTPTLASPLYDTPFAITSSMTVKARAYLPGYTASDVATATFTILEQTAAPVISPPGGTSTGSAQVTLSTSTPGATIRYTTNGSEPASFSALYDGQPIILGVGQHTVKAKAFLPGTQPSTTSSAFFTVYESPSGTVADPIITPLSTRYFVEPFTVSMHTDTEGATIYYTMQNGSLPPDPTTSSTVYTGPIPVNNNGQWYFKARAFKAGSTPSGIVQTGMLSLGNAAGTTNVPTITPNGGVFTNTVKVTLSTPDQFEAIYYTTDGSEPVAVPPVLPPSHTYNSPFNVSSPATVRARASRTLFASGGIASAEFTFVCDTPTITAAGDEEVEVSISTGTMNAKIYYTLDGSEPDESATEYTGSFTLPVGNHVVKARCFRNPQNYEPSATALSVVVVQPEPVAPTFIQQPVNKVAFEGQQVTFGAEATGVPAPMYQWQRDGINLAGQTEPELTIAAARPGDAGTYRLLAWNSAGEVYSQEVTLTVNSSSDPGPGDPGDPDYDYDMYMPLLIR